MSTPDPNQSTLSSQHSAPNEEPGALDAVAAVLLIAALAFAIIARFNDPGAEGRYRARQASALLSQGRYSEAVSSYEALLPAYSAPDVRLALSYAYLARLDPDRAERQARAALDAAPPDLKSAAWAQLGRVLSYAGKESEALDAWSQAIDAARSFSASPPVEAEARSARWHIAMSAWSRRDYTRALPHLQSLLDGTDIYAASARAKLAQFYAPKHNDISREMLAGMKAPTGGNKLGPGAQLSMDSTTGAAIPDLRVPGLREGLSTDALQSLPAQLQLAQSEVERARYSDTGALDAFWGRAFLQQGDPYLARTYLERAVAARPDLSDAHSYLALAMIATGASVAAMPHLDRAIALDPARPLPRYILAQQLINAQDWDRASAQLAAIKKLEPDTVQMHLQLASYYLARSAYDLAEDEYLAAYNKQRGSSPKPGDIDAALALSRFYTDQRGLGCDKGLPAARESLAHHPDDPASQDAVGWSLLQCNKPNEALSSLESAVRAAPEVARFHFHLGQAYAQLNRPADAREQYNRAIDLDPHGPWEHLAQTALPTLTDK